MIGGSHLDIKSVKNKDVLQLQQTIIFLKSEIAKYQNEISTLQQSIDNNSIVSSHEQEVNQLVNEKQALSMELMLLRKSFEKELSALQETIQTREEQRLKLISSIEELVKKKEILQIENQQLKETIEKTTKLESPTATSDHYIEAVKKLDHLLHPFISHHKEQLTSLQESINLQSPILKEIKNKNEEIHSYLMEIAPRKEPEQNIPSKAAEATSSTRISLENQLQHLFIQATSFDTELDEKLRILDEFDDKVLLLAIEIEKYKNGHL